MNFAGYELAKKAMDKDLGDDSSEDLLSMEPAPMVAEVVEMAEADAQLPPPAMIAR
jgi:hypothetical protein